METRLRLIELCDISQVPPKFVDMYKFIVVYQDQASIDRAFSMDDFNALLPQEHIQTAKEFIQYGTEKGFIEDADKPLSKLSVKFGR